MCERTEMAERQDRGLALLSEQGLSLAARLHERAMAAEDDAELARLALAWQRVARSVRQTYALELKAERERRAAEREAAHVEMQARRNEPVDVVTLEPGPDPAPVIERIDQLRSVVEKLIWNEAEPEEQDYLIALLDERLEIASRNRKVFLAQTPHTQVWRLCDDFDLPRPTAEQVADALEEADADPGAYEPDFGEAPEPAAAVADPLNSS